MMAIGVMIGSRITQVVIHTWDYVGFLQNIGPQFSARWSYFGGESTIWFWGPLSLEALISASCPACIYRLFARPLRYVHIAMMTLLLPLAWACRKDDSSPFLASAKDVCVFLPLWAAWQGLATWSQMGSTGHWAPNNCGTCPMTKVVSNYGLALRLRNGTKLLPRLLLYNPCIAQNPGMVSSVDLWLINWVIDWVSDRLIDWLSEWVSEWVIDGLIDWLIDWLIDCVWCGIHLLMMHTHEELIEDIVDPQPISPSGSCTPLKTDVFMCGYESNYYLILSTSL